MNEDLAGSSRLRILLFDWTVGGHHAVYLERIAGSLASAADVTVVAPGPLLTGLREVDADLRPLARPRPPLDAARPVAAQHRELALEEIELLRRACEEVRPDFAVHLYADPVLRRLIDSPPLPCPTTLCLFFPRAHYPKVFGSPLSAGERLHAQFFEHLVRRWRKRADAHALFALDQEAVRRWNRSKGALAYWLPEPPVEVSPRMSPAVERSGFLLYGMLARRKGVHLLASALALTVTPIRVTLAGEVEPGYAPELEHWVEVMRRADVVVDLQLQRQTEADCLRLASSAACVLLPYPRHYGASRVLLEAACAGAPILAHDFGLIGHLVKRHSLGIAVDCTDLAQFRGALLSLSEDAHFVERHKSHLRDFAAQYSSTRFLEAIHAPFLEAASHA